VSSENIPSAALDAFTELAKKFFEKTHEYVVQGINPGGIYQAIWCRDASYILIDWFMSGNIHGTMQQIHQIWSHQISSPSEEKIVYGRGSIDMKFLSEVYDDKKKQFSGALPTTFYQAGFSEVYGRNPDIDSTALMISTTSWILDRWHNKKNLGHGAVTKTDSVTNSDDTSDYVSGLLLEVGITDPVKLTDYVLPRMFKAVEYLLTRDKDNDGLLEQGHNEDWMDTILRAGKVVYSQACWILALTNFAILLSTLDKNEESQRMTELALRAVNSVNDLLWSEEDSCYLDIQAEHHLGGHYRTLMQDISLYLIAAHSYLSTGKTQNENQEEIKLSEQIQTRSLKTLDTMKKRLWKDGWPLVTEVELKKTGPWVLKPHQYHNETIWPWTTALEMLARSKFNLFDDCDALLSKLSSGQPYMYCFYEWINPVDKRPKGAFPFRTGISATRIAVANIVQH
jgi:glycogen debranching enzyme